MQEHMQRGTTDICLEKIALAYMVSVEATLVQMVKQTAATVHKAAALMVTAVSVRTSGIGSAYLETALSVLPLLSLPHRQPQVRSHSLQLFVWVHLIWVPCQE